MVKCNNTIAILLGTFNGERFIREQLDSLIGQTCADWELFINDDGSDDATISIVESYCEKDSRIHILDLAKHVGACRNFLTLLQNVDADYYMFCDQDDVWHSDKIEKSLAAMKEQECGNNNNSNNNGCNDSNNKNSGSSKPVIVHTDLRMVDATGACIGESFWKYSRIIPSAINEFRNYASTCVATGCTMLFNKAAKECVKFNPSHARMHDAWVTLCVAKNNGIVYALNSATIDYRQHDNNTIGIPDIRIFQPTYKILCFARVLRDNYRQYKMLKELGFPGIITYVKEKIAYRRQLTTELTTA